MKAGDQAFYTTIYFETRNRPYTPSTYINELGQRCVGYGHVVLSAVGPERVFTPLGREQARAILAKDFAKIEEPLNARNLQLTQNQFDALVCLGYHTLWGRVGAPNQTFENSRLLQLIAQGMMELAGAEFDQWVIVNNRISRSARERRAREKELFFKCGSSY